MIINFLDVQWFQVYVGGLTLLAAIYIGIKQNQINERFGKLNDVVELHGALLIISSKDNLGREILKEYICIQNIGTRIIYLESYIFNGSKFELNNHILASTYSQTLANYYQVELPINTSTHVSLEIMYKDIDGRRWKSEIFADKLQSGVWKVSPFPKKEIK